jgi:NitT/TauT family transport system permease protein
MSAATQTGDLTPVGRRRSLRLRLSRRPLALIVPLLLLALWWWGTAGRPDGLIPPPPVVAVALWDLAFGGIYDDAFSGMLLPDLIASVSRVYGAFLLAAAVALPLGMLIGRLRLVRELLEPTLQLLRPIPVTAWLPLSMIMFGRLFPKVVLPASLPGMFTGLRLGLGFAWVVIVVGEMTGVQTGLGAMIMDARQLSRTEIVIAGMAVIGCAGFLSDLAIQAVGRRLLAWSPMHG